MVKRISFNEFMMQLFVVRNIEKFIATKNGYLNKFYKKWTNSFFGNMSTT